MNGVPNTSSIVTDYLNDKIVPEFSNLNITDAAGLKVHSLELAQVAETEMREKMYSTDLFNEETFYLEEIDEEVFNSFGTVEDHSVLLMKKNLSKRTWSSSVEKVKELMCFTSLGNVLVAGGAVYASLFDVTQGDIDIFLYGLSPLEAEKKVGQIAKLISLDRTQVLRTKNAITFINTSLEVDVQIILRLYRTKSEILHGFDVDSCCLGYDGERIWATRRALFSLQNGYNTVSFERLSPSYEYRLVKYATKGMAIKIPDFSRDKVRTEELEKYYEENKAGATSFHSNYKHLQKLKGLDIILFFDHRMRTKKKSFNKAAEKLCKETSDYSPTPLSKYNYGSIGTSIMNVLDYFDNSRDKYKEYSDIYCPLLEDWFNTCAIYRFDARIKDETLMKDITNCRQCRYGYENYCENHKEMVMSKQETVRNEICNRITEEFDVNKNGVVSFLVNNLLMSGSLFMVKGSIYYIREILHFPETLYKGLSAVRPITFPQNVEWKVTNPGEQMTNTFNQIVLQDNSTWYNCSFYEQ